MRSIFGAMVWETLKRGSWVLPIGFLGGNALNVLFFASLAGTGIVVLNNHEFVIWHLLASQVNMMCFACALVVAQGKSERFFTLPISNRTFAAYQLLIGMVLMFVESAVSAALMNAYYGLDWPVWGPALYAAAALAMCCAAAWLGSA